MRTLTLVVLGECFSYLANIVLFLGVWLISISEICWTCLSCVYLWTALPVPLNPLWPFPYTTCTCTNITGHSCTSKFPVSLCVTIFQCWYSYLLFTTLTKETSLFPRVISSKLYQCLQLLPGITTVANVARDASDEGVKSTSTWQCLSEVKTREESSDQHVCLFPVFFPQGYE